MKIINHFINEIGPVLTTLGDFKCEIILTGDY